MNATSKRKESKLWTLIYIGFFLSFLILVGLLTVRLIEQPSHNIADITIFFPLVLIFVIIVMSLALLFIFGRGVDGNQIKLIIYFTLLICVAGLSWSLRGVWGHETGTFVWGTLLCSILMLENRRDHWIYFIFFANLGLAIGANLPFANYPFIPRLLHFATWGMLGMFFAAFGRYFFYKNEFESKEDFKEFHIKVSIAGFIGLALGITFASALNINPGWTAGWLGGYVTGGFYGLILGIFLYYNNKNYEEEITLPEFQQLDQNFIKPETKFKRFLKIVMYITLFGYVPVAGFLNVANYYYSELQYPEFPALLIFILCIIYIVVVIVIIFRYSSKLGNKDNFKLELLYLFILTLWLSSFSAILRHDIGKAPDLIYIIQSFEFELSIVIFSLISSVLFIIYLLIDKSIEKRED
ncbi:MAG: hypothetical protein ACTSR8_07855 [Promethearchaeota archaeon]